MTTGEQIAKEFSDDKCHLSDAEQRRLAGMIDAELSRTVEALRAALYGADPVDWMPEMEYRTAEKDD